MNVDPPVYPGCAYGKAHRKPWRTKPKKGQVQRGIQPATCPGQVVSIDQLVSPTPGFVPTHRGIPTTSRYKGATIFVDHHSDFTYAHLMKELDAEATVQAKQEFERQCALHGVQVQHYHADNGLFNTKAFKTSCAHAKQGLTFCGVNAHHQNGKAESRIKDVTTNARTALLHAAHRWPKAIHPSLWPSSIKHYVNLRNSLPTHFTPEQRQGRRKLPAEYKQSPLSKFSKTEVEPNLHHFHPFGSPVYVLENTLQSQHSHNKWSDRSRVGIFLCHSPLHAKNVPLILNTQTGNVSPQFHCIYDDGFDTCKTDAKFKSLWQSKAKLTVQKMAPSELDVTIVDKGNVRTASASPSKSMPRMFQTPWNTDNLEEQQEHTTTVNDDANDTTASQTPESSTDAHQSVQPETFSAPVKTTRSGRVVKPSTFFDPSYYWHNANLSFLSTFHPETPSTDDSLLQPTACEHSPHPYSMLLQHSMALIASNDPDIMTLEEALKQPD